MIKTSFNPHSISSLPHSNPLLQQHQSSDSKRSNSYMTLTQKQIIIQLKCLVAKQENQINHLLAEIEKIKKQNNYHYHEEDLANSKNHKYNEKSPSPSRSELGHYEFVSSQRSDNDVLNSVDRKLEMNRQSQKEQEMEMVKNIRQIVDEFMAKVYSPLLKKYQTENFDQIVESPKVQKNMHKSNSKKSITHNVPSPTKHKLKSKNLNKFSFQNMSQLTHTLPKIFQSIKNLLLKLDQSISHYHDKQNQFKQKIKTQQKMLKQIMAEYQKNIVESQKIQQKLIKELKNTKKYQNSFIYQKF